MSMREWLKPGGALGAALAFVGALGLTAYGITDEVEVSDVEGTVTMLDTGEPAKNTEVHLEQYAQGKDLSGLITLRTMTDSQGRFTFRNVPVGSTQIRAYAPGYSADRWTYVRRSDDGTETRVMLALKWEGDRLEVGTNQPVYTPEEHPSIVLSGLTRRSELAISVFAFSEEEIFEKRDTYMLTRDIAYNRQWDMRPDRPEPEPIHKFDHKLGTRDIQGKFAETVELPSLEEGLYVVRAEADDIMRHQWINVSRLGLVTKVSPEGLTGYVVDITSGEPRSGVAITVVGEDGRREIGRTNGDGIVTATPSREDGRYVMLATDGTSRAFSMYYSWQDSDGQVAAIHFQTDRPVYRPGDTVHYKGFVRVPAPSGYVLPRSRDADVKILDPEGSVLRSDRLPISATGGFDASFDTVEELLGSYQIQATIDGQTFTEWVPILAYRKPEFKVTVTPVKDYFIIGERAQFRIKAEYFTGEPVPGAELTGWAYRAENWRWSPFDDEEYAWWAYEGDDVGGGEHVGEYKARTDENGEAVITVPTVVPEREQSDYWTARDFVYTLQVHAQDVSGRFFDGTGRVDVVRGDIDLSVAFEDYVVVPNSPVQVRLRGREYGSDDPAAGASVTLEYGERVWTGKKMRNEKKGAQRTTLDANGEATVTLRPSGSGDYYVTATTRDSAGRVIEAKDYIWVYERGADFAGPKPKLQVVLDKKSYNVGETATAVVRTDKPGGHALVTIEGHGILWSRVVELGSEATSVSVPVTQGLRPNASLQVAYIREKSFASSGRSLVIEMGRDELDVTIEPNVSETLPGSAVTYTVTTKDANGDPVRADVCVSVVDEGVYSVREDTTDPLGSFFPPRWSTVSTYYSFPEVHLDGDEKSGIEGELRTDFRDTAFWAPSVETGPDGTATVAVRLPDNLTSWRATATAVTDSAKAGKGKSSVVARKPLMLRVSPPAFMVQNETQTLGVSVRNETDRASDVEVRLQTTGLRIEGTTTQRVSLRPRSTGRIEWQVRAEVPGEARVRLQAASATGGHTDGMEIGFPVYTNGPTLESYHAGDTDTRASFTMRLEPNAVAGELQVTLTPSILASVTKSIDELVDYPYGCVEQTMSRFMPAVVVRQFMAGMGIDRPDLDRKIADVSRQSQARLKSMQNSDGSFGWFSYDGANPEMTALVLEGLYHASAAGLDVDAHVRDRALQWAKEYAVNTVATAGLTVERARLAYALALHDVPFGEWSRLLPTEKSLTGDPRLLAYVVLALHKADQSPTLRRAAYSALLDTAKESETAVSWSAEWWYEPTAVALLAVVKTDPESPIATKGMRYLMNARRGDYWTSTRDTAQIVIAAVEYMKASRETRPDFQARVTVNGVDAGLFRFALGDLSKSDTARVPVSDLRAGDNEVVVEMAGQGRVYYSAKLTRSLYDQNPRPTDSGDGLTISRQYFRMETRRLEDGTLQRVPSRNPVVSARPGEVLHCRLTIDSKDYHRSVMVRDPALSNCRTIDISGMDRWSWSYWWSGQSTFDDHTALFMWSVEPGSHVVEYAVRAEAIGTSIALPATVSLMYQPDIRATTGSTKLEVRQ